MSRVRIPSPAPFSFLFRHVQDTVDPLPELERQIARYLEELKRENASAHTLRSYATDLRQWRALRRRLESEPRVVHLTHRYRPRTIVRDLESRIRWRTRRRIGV